MDEEPAAVESAPVETPNVPEVVQEEAEPIVNKSPTAGS